MKSTDGEEEIQRGTFRVIEKFPRLYADRRNWQSIVPARCTIEETPR